MKITCNNNAFIIDCNFHENHVVSMIPHRRFDRKSRLWRASKIKVNARYLLAHLKEHMDELSVVEAEKLVDIEIGNGQSFPAWFQFKTQPFDHQIVALDKVWGKNTFALFMEMGTGKSKVAIDNSAAKFQDGIIDFCLVICPNSVVTNWASEIKTHSNTGDDKIFTTAGVSPKKVEKFAENVRNTENPYLVVGAESLQVGYKSGAAFNAALSCLIGKKYAVIVDESHMMKNPESNRSRNVQFLAQNAIHKLIMTGTPVLQNVQDLYQQFAILDESILGCGSYYGFKNEYVVYGGYKNKEIIGHKNLDKLMSDISPYVYQVTKKECLSLPEKLYSTREVKMTTDQLKIYNEIDNQLKTVLNDESGDIEFIVRSALTKYNLLQQISSGFIYQQDKSGDAVEVVPLQSNPKINELKNIIEENPNKKIIIWARLKQEIRMISQQLRSWYGDDLVVEFHGNISQKDRVENLSKFKNGDALYFVASQSTGGVGLTINESNLVVYMSNGFKLVDRVQSEDRCHRIGQNNNVSYIDILCGGSKDREILSCLQGKMDLSDYIKAMLNSSTYQNK